MSDFDFSPSYSSAIGFDSILNTIQCNSNKVNNEYPPYNIEIVNDNNYRITIATLGFCLNDLDITLQDNFLVVKGKNSQEKRKGKYLYRGILQQNFERKFQLSDKVSVVEAQLENGLLIIELEYIVLKTDKPKGINIIK